MFSFDSMWTYLIFIVPALIVAGICQGKVQTNFNKYSRIANYKGLTGYDIARSILDRNGLFEVKIDRVGGNLTDHYDPRTQVIRLSDNVFSQSSVAAIGIAAHEVGHAIQHAQGYTPIKIRNMILPVANIGSNLTFPLILLGIIFSIQPLIIAGIIAFSAATLFQLVTLPVEFDASRRALANVSAMNLVSNEEEFTGAKKVLSAAAMTYVASLLVSLASLLRLVFLFIGRRD